MNLEVRIVDCLRISLPQRRALLQLRVSITCCAELRELFVGFVKLFRSRSKIHKDD